MNLSSSLLVQYSNKLQGSINLLGDKSISHRVLLLAGLANGVSDLRNLLKANVTDAMIDCLSQLGVGFTFREEDLGRVFAEVTGKDMKLDAQEAPLNCRGSATTMRLLAGVLAGRNFESTLDGIDRLRLRPMRRIIEPLESKGAKIISNNGFAPLKFMPAVLKSSSTKLKVASAQVKSAILLAGLESEGMTEVIEPTTSRDHTERLFRRLGIPIEEETTSEGKHIVRIQGPVQHIPPLDMTLPGDPSSAAFIVVAALQSPNGAVTLPNVCLNPGRMGIYEALNQMGADIQIYDQSNSYGETVGTISAKSTKLTGTTVGGRQVPAMIDEFPIFALAATQADGTTIVRDAEELRYKESDRIEALAEELRKMGAIIETKADGFVITGPTSLKGAEVNCKGDHRLAMTLVIAGLIAEGTTKVNGWSIINDSFPNFIETLQSLGANIEW